MKPTRIWGSPEITRLRPKVCDWVTCPNLEPGTRHHRVRLSSATQNKPAAEKYRIPEGLIRELAGFPPDRVRVNTARTATLNEVVKRGKKNRQLLMEIKAKSPRTGDFVLRVLIDTGAEANLIRRGLLPPM
jgi:hypothetical protein